ncbi:MAG: DUF2339 domain-containing protein [Candidatus Woesearchaeota archaeon]
MPQQDLAKQIALIQKRQNDFAKRVERIESYLDLKPIDAKPLIEEQTPRAHKRESPQTSNPLSIIIPIGLIVIGVFLGFAGFGFFAIMLFFVGILALLFSNTSQDGPEKKTSSPKQHIKKTEHTSHKEPVQHTYHIKKHTSTSHASTSHASTSHASTSHASTSHASTSLEQNIGAKFFAGIGIFALVIGIGLFLKYAIDNNWISPLFRVLLGVGFGVSIIALGHVLSHRKILTNWTHVVIGGGFAIVYFAVYAAYHFEHYRQAIGMSLLINSILLLLVASIGLVMSLRHNSWILVTYYILLGYITSWLSLHIDALGIVYLLLITLVAGLISAYKQWPYVAVMSTVVSLLSYAIIQYTMLHSTLLAIILLIGYIIIFMVQNTMLSKQYPIQSVLLHTIGSLVWYLLFIPLFDQKGFVTLGLGIVFALHYVLQKHALKQASAYMALAYIALGFALQLDTYLLTIVWSLMLAMLAVTYVKFDSKIAKYSMYVLSIPLLFKTFVYDIVLLDVLPFFFLSTRSIAVGATILAFVIAYVCCCAKKDQYAIVYAWLAFALLSLLLFIEIQHVMPLLIVLSILAIALQVGSSYYTLSKTQELAHQGYVTAFLMGVAVMWYNPSVFWYLGVIVLLYALMYYKGVMQKDIVATSNAWIALLLVIIVALVHIESYLLSIVMLALFALITFFASSKHTMFFIHSNIYAFTLFVYSLFPTSQVFFIDVSIITTLITVVLMYFFFAHTQQNISYVYAWLGYVGLLLLVLLHAPLSVFIQMIALGIISGALVYRYGSPVFLAQSILSTIVLLALNGYAYTLEVTYATLFSAVVFYCMYGFLTYKKQIFSVMYAHIATLLVVLYIGDTASQFMVSLGWLAFALLLLVVGFATHQKLLRMHSFIIFGLVILKIFLYDTRLLEPVLRTLAYIALGVILLSISFVYTRFKDKIKELL